MAATREVSLFVLLLSCWHEAELQPIKMSSGPTSEMPPTSKTQEDIPGIFDEILIQEMLEPNKSSGAGTHRTAATLSTRLFKEKNAGIDENDQVGGPEGYHDLSEYSQFSLGSEDQFVNNEPRADDSYQVGGPEGHRGSHFPSSKQDKISKNGKCNLEIASMFSVDLSTKWTSAPSSNRTSKVCSDLSKLGKNISKTDQYESISVLDKIFQNIGKSSGNSFQ